MYLAYSLLSPLILIPYFLFNALRHGKYLTGLRQRFGSVPPVDGKRVIWLHCVSVGETQAARPLVQRLKQQFPHHALVVSTITPTGQKLAADVFFKQAERIFYFPLDWRWTVRRTLKAINPELVLIMETEIWPNFLRECKARQIPVAIVNGRISERSFRRYNWIRPLLGSMFSSINVAAMQSSIDADRIGKLGMPKGKLFTAGNLKFDAGMAAGLSDKADEFRARFGSKPGEPLVLAASTHAPEEEIILKAIKQLRKTTAVRLMIAPRHPERFEGVANQIQQSGLSWTKRSSPPAAADRDADVILLDSIGELSEIFELAEIVFVGGSIANHGGHNVAEPAAAGVVVITGANTQNFQAIVPLMLEAGAIVQLPPLDSTTASDELAKVIARLLANPDERANLRSRAEQLVKAHQGAADRTIKLIAPLVPVVHTP